jgi:prepilin peptidase CpaA
MTLAIALTLTACVLASYWDVRKRRIPNWLTGSLALAAIAIHAFSGFQAAVTSIAVMLVLALGGTLLYARGGIGGGDIKLAIAGSGMLSFPLCIPFLIYTAIGGGILAVLFLLFGATASPSLARVVMLATSPGNGVAAKRATLPYAVAFAFGALLVALSQNVAPFLRIAI